MAKSKKRKSAVLYDESVLRRRYEDSGLASNILVKGEDELRLPCRVLSVNYHLGGGIPYGKIVENFGEESTGKTLLAKDFAVVAQSLGGVVLWDDAESTFDAEWAEAHGLDLSRVELLKYENRIEVISDWIADFCIYWRSKLVNNEPILLVIDSIAVLETVEAMDTAQADTKAEMGRRSFKMGEMLRKRTGLLAKYGICVYFINQLRKKIGAGMFEDPDTTPMAQCMKYYASQRFGLYRGKKIKNDEGKWVGNFVYVRTKKNKSSVPMDSVQAKVYFRKDGHNFGYSKYFGLEELLVEKGIVERRKGKFFYNEELIAKSEEKFLDVIAEDSKLRKKFIEALNINTPSKLRKKLESLEYNRYPVKLKPTKKSDDEEGEE